MIRSLKTLGLALVAVLALSAVVASAASAAPKLTSAGVNGLTEEYPVTLKGNQSTTNVFELEGGRKVECTGATFEGTIANKAEAEESKLTTKPTYSGCTATILGNKDLATVTLNGCDYLLHSTETTTGTIKTEGWEVTGTADIKCEGTNKIEIHVFTTEAKDLEGKPLCTYNIGAQNAKSSLDFQLNEKAKFKKEISPGVFEEYEAGTSGTINATITGVTTTRASGTETNCGLETQSGKLTGGVKVEGFNSKGEMVRGRFED